MEALALDGMKVVDFSRVLSGPYCSMVLADFGAEVLKIERFPEGDDSRRFAPHVNGESFCFASANRNKKSVALDLKSAQGRDLALKMMASADVVIENFRPGVVRRLGLSYEDIQPSNPELIYCSISGFGQTGPYRLRAGYDIIAQGVGGFLRMTGEPDGDPTKVGIAVNDIAAGAIAVQSIMAAYIHRLKKGTGQYIDLSLVDCGLSWAIWESAALFGSGEVPLPTGTRHRRSTPYQAYRTQDGFVTIGAGNDRLWGRLCAHVLERPELGDDPRFKTLSLRMEHIDDLEREIESVLIAGSTAYWVQKLDAAGIPGGPVLTFDETVKNEQVVARGMVHEVDHPAIGPMKMIAPPHKLSTTPPTIRGAAPVLGEHTLEALEGLGVDPDEAARLVNDGVIFQGAKPDGSRPA